MIEKPLYRTHIVSYPEFEEYLAFDDRNEPHTEPWHRPVGWEASADYIEHYGTNKFFEPRTERWYKSRSSAADRASLLNSMGYVAIVQRSAPVEWPADGQEKVNDSSAREVVDAIRTLVKAGVVRSADDLLKTAVRGGRR